MKVPATTTALSRRAFLASSGLTVGGLALSALTAGEPSKTTAGPKLLDETGWNRVEGILNEKDKRLQETKYVNETWPVLRPKLMELYKAEAEDNKLLKLGRITEKDRKVKICFSDFNEPGGTVHDDGGDTRLHVVKYYNGIYVNEHWPIDPENGNIIFPDTIRIRGVEGPFNTEGDKYLTDNIGIVWQSNESSGRSTPKVIPKLYRQHNYKPMTSSTDDNGKQIRQGNKTNNVRFAVSSPTSCIGCHNPSDSKSFTEALFLYNGEKRTNLRAITPDSEFKKDYKHQLGFKNYSSYLDDLVKAGKLNKKGKATVLQRLEDTTHMENPGLIGALKSNDIPWVESDELSGNYQGDFRGFYRYGGRVQAGFARHHDPTFIWWSPYDAVAISSDN